MEVVTQVPSTGTKLHIDADREFDHQSGDAVLRILGQASDGHQVLDAAYVQCNATEANLIGYLLRQTLTPQPETTDVITQEILAAFGSQLSARQASQISQMASRAQWSTLSQQLATDQQNAERQINELAERFQRASAKAETPAFAGSGNGEGTPGGRSRPGQG